jgi:hypothetical protein
MVQLQGFTSRVGQLEFVATNLHRFCTELLKQRDCLRRDLRQRGDSVLRGDDPGRDRDGWIFRVRVGHPQRDPASGAGERRATAGPCPVVRATTPGAAKIFIAPDRLHEVVAVSDASRRELGIQGIGASAAGSETTSMTVGRFEVRAVKYAQRRDYGVAHRRARRPSRGLHLGSQTLGERRSTVKADR